MQSRLTYLWVLGSFLLVAVTECNRCNAVEVFSAGMQVPQTISKVPAGFGSFEGDFFVPDPKSTSTDPFSIWAVPASGGPPAEFVSLPRNQGSEGPRGGLFLPNDFGAVGGRYLTSILDMRVFSGDPAQLDQRSRIVTIDGAGAIEDFAVFEYHGPADARPNSEFIALTTPLIAPEGFGPLGGNLIFTDQNDGVFSVDQDGNVGPVLFDPDSYSDERSGTMNPRVQPYGAVFAPEEFGNVGGSLLISDGLVTLEPPTAPIFPSFSTEILSVRSDGMFEVFATIPVSFTQFLKGVGLRQMAFVPPGFDDLSGLLLVSVSGSRRGGGIFGAVYAIDELGAIVKALRPGGEIRKLDPRGFYFTEDGRILISDASDPILLASVDDFVSIPEPASVISLVTAATFFLVARRIRLLNSAELNPQLNVCA
jgi:hypothetical protein